MMVMTQTHLMLTGQSVEVVPIRHRDAKLFVLRHHYSGSYPTGAMFHFGKVEDGILVGVCVFGSPASPWVSVSATGERNRVLELQRLALAHNRPNEASWFVARVLRLLSVEWTGLLVSYADTDQGHHGGVYQAAGLYYAGCSSERTDMFADGHARHHAGNPTQRQRRSAKHRYWLSVPRFTHDHECLWPKLPYPKPDHRHAELLALCQTPEAP